MKSVPKQECYKLPSNESYHPNSFSLYKKIPEINDCKRTSHSNRFLELTSSRIYHLFQLILTIILFFLTYYCLYENYTIKTELRDLTEKFQNIELNEDFSKLKKRYINDQFESRIRDHIVVPDHKYIDEEATTSTQSHGGHIVVQKTVEMNEQTTTAEFNGGHIVTRHTFSNQDPTAPSTKESMGIDHIVNRPHQEPTASTTQNSINSGHIINRHTFASDEQTTPSSRLMSKNKDGSSYVPAHLCTCPIGFYINHKS